MSPKPKFQILYSVCAFMGLVVITLAVQNANPNEPYPVDPNYDFTNGEAEVISYEAREPKADEIAITQKYYEIAEKWVGEFPLDLINAADAQLMPVVRTNDDFTVDTLTLSDISAASVPRIRANGRDRVQIKNAIKRGVTQSDKPSAIFRDMENLGTMPGSRIMRVSKGDVDWVYIFRKTSKLFNDPNLYQEIGLIAYNRQNGKTFYFAGAESWTFKIKGPWKHSKGPNQKVDVNSAEVGVLAGKDIPPPSANNPESVKHWRIPLGNGCTTCHSAGPFVSFPFTDFRGFEKETGKPIYYKQPASQKEGKFKLPGKYGEHVVPVRTPGMLYDPFVYQLDDEFVEFINNYKPVDPDDSYVKNIKALIKGAEEKPHEFKVQRLVNEEFLACQTCHQIGNLNYIQRFPFEAFWYKGLPKTDQLHERAQLYRKNISESLQKKPNRFGRKKRKGQLTMAGFHNRKIEGGGFNKFVPQNLEVYTKALNTIQDINDGKTKAKLKDHWTLENIKLDTWSFVKEQCSYCHTGNKDRKSGKSRFDFTTEGKLSTYLQDPDKWEIAKMYLKDEVSPMPPSGMLQESVREVLIKYLKGLRN